MAHEIGQYDFCLYGSQPAWHRLKQNTLGTDHLGRTITAAEAKREIGFKVATEPLRIVGLTGPVNGYRVNVRLDMPADDPNRVVGIVGDDYHVIQNEEVIDIVDAFATACGGGIESAFTMLNGRRVVVAAKIGDQMTIRGGGGSEPMQGYLWSYSSHDGAVRATMRLANLLPVCMNTVLAASRQRSNVIKITHTASASAAIKRAKAAAAGSAAYYGDMLAALSFLADTPATGEVREAFLDELFPMPAEPAAAAPEATQKSFERARKAVAKKRDQVLIGFEGDEGGMDIPTRRGTLFGLVQCAAGIAEHSPSFRVAGGRDNASDEDIAEAKLRGLFEGTTGRRLEQVYAVGMKVAAAC